MKAANSEIPVSIRVMARSRHASGKILIENNRVWMFKPASWWDDFKASWGLGHRSVPVLADDGRDGFTLVEMLVSTALVVLIMLIFAQIYRGALGSIRSQRAMANNDQKARMVSTLLRSDLQNMTYRQSYVGKTAGIVPLAAGDESIIDTSNQRGYFYYSENDPENDADDVLQFTTQINKATRDTRLTKTQQEFIGRALNLGLDNEPDLDDAIQDGLSDSKAVEVSYFLRKGNLYRRVLLLRDTLLATQDEQPSDGGMQHYTGAGQADYENDNFWSDFDFSATRHYDDVMTPVSHLHFNSLKSLGNEFTLTNQPLGVPWYRFGFLDDPTNATDHGTPREYSDETDQTTFIGRFTHEETSFDQMKYPGTMDHRFNRNDADTLDSNWTLNIGGTVFSGDRVGEDLLLTGVEGFDVEILDPLSQEFVNIGDAGTTFAASLNPNYGPHVTDPTLNNIFDTWHPSAEINGVTDPPFRPVINESDPFPTWTSGTYNLGDVVAANTFVTQGPRPAWIYEVVQVDDADSSGMYESGSAKPAFPATIGNVESDGELTWICKDNRLGVRAIRVTFRYKDPLGLPRQVTVVHSFVE